MITNVVGLVAAVLGDRFLWWIDPAGAVLLAVYTIANWSGTVLEQAGLLPKSSEFFVSAALVLLFRRS